MNNDVVFTTFARIVYKKGVCQGDTQDPAFDFLLGEE